VQVVGVIIAVSEAVQINYDLQSAEKLVIKKQ
jgi:hypothetical protein